MAIAHKPPADIIVDAPLVQALLRAQHPDLARLPLAAIGEGWDNTLFRLGDDLVVRLPRRAASAALVEREQRWLPVLAARVPLPIPAPVRVGRAACGYPWSWSIVPWLSGTPLERVVPADFGPVADTLAQFLGALHQPASADAPFNPWRAVPLAARATALHQHLDQLAEYIDRDAVLTLWERTVDAPAWPGPPVWIHGDLHPGNLLVDRDQLSAVIDFGDLTAGDPATDWSIAWMLPASAGQRLVHSARAASPMIDEHLWARARGWALALGLAYLASSGDDPAATALARRAIDAALAGDLDT